MAGVILTIDTLQSTELTDNTSGLITPAFLRNTAESCIAAPQVRKTISYTAQLIDRGTVIKMNSATAVNFTIPAGIFSAGMSVGVRQEGAGQVTIVGSGGVTFSSAPGTVTTRTQNSLVWATADPDTANLFWLDGDLT